jgi:hypothetical protein
VDARKPTPWLSPTAGRNKGVDNHRHLVAIERELGLAERLVGQSDRPLGLQPRLQPSRHARLTLAGVGRPHFPCTRAQTATQDVSKRDGTPR